MEPATTRNRRIVLRRRPGPSLSADDFELTEGIADAPGEGQVLLRNLFLSIDPAIRGWMDEGESYIEPIPIGGVIRAGCVGEVVRSNSARHAVGDHVVGLSGWEDYSVVDAASLGRTIPQDTPLPLSTALSVVGGTGLTAYFGLLDVGRPKEGQTVVVSAAAGGVGSVVGQLAKLHGCRAVGITGSDDKCSFLLDELGYDAAINYRDGDLRARLKQACPRGIHIYFDNVGGEILDAALGRIATGGCVVLCGNMSGIGATERPAGPSNYIRLLTKRARMQGFVLLDYMPRWEQGSAELTRWVVEGKLRYREEVVEGLQNAPEALMRLFAGDNRGKMMVRP